MSFFEKLGIIHTNLVGHSLGGRIGLLVAASCPEKIKNLIPECGHVPQEEKPKIVCKSVTEFIWSKLPA
jgi:pimeloyl-ACP methyl ester carboxylesterase